MTRAFPLPLLALPLAVMFIRTGLDDTIIGLALVHATLALPFAVLITFSLFSGIPVELEEAAWTLGCTRLQAFRKVILPLAAPGIAPRPSSPSSSRGTRSSRPPSSPSRTRR
jgi:multiple sugar transport system permease protein